MNTPSESSRLPVALTVAGSDSGGGAGIQADLKTFHAFGVFGTSVVTAVTAQNTMGVRAVHAIPPEVVRAQVDAVAEDLPVSALKTGMLATATLVETVAEAVEAHGLAPLVVDPVMVATSGDRLLDPGAEAAVRRRLLPLAALVTPNVPEAEVLTGMEVRTPDAMAEAGARLLELGAGAALLKGGHLEGEVVDVLVTPQGVQRWERTRIHTRHTHGTGCTLSAAVAALLARGESLDAAVEGALHFVERAIRSAPGLGGGRGPLNHFAPVD